MISLRVSSLDSLWGCAPSVLNDSMVRVNTAGMPALLGKVIHRVAANLVAGESPDVLAECGRFGYPDTDEAAKLARALSFNWYEVRQHFPDPATEQRRTVKARDVEVSGTIDLVSPGEKYDYVFGDWKSGWIDRDYVQQMNGYAWLLWVDQDRPADFSVAGILFKLRKGTRKVTTWTADQLREWEDDLLRNVLARRDEYRPEAQRCANCVIRPSCPAFGAIVKRATETMLHREPADRFVANVTRLLAHLTPENKHEPEVAEAVNQILFNCDAVQDAVDQTREMLKANATRVGGIPLGEGVELRDVVQNPRTLDTVKAWPVLKRHLSEAELLPAAKVSLPAAMIAVSAKHSRGPARKAACQKLEDELEAAGAIVRSPRHTLQQVDTTEEEHEQHDVRVDGTAVRALPGPAPSAGEREGTVGGGDARGAG